MIRNTFVLLGGIVLGSTVNMLIIALGAEVIPPPPGVNANSVESIAQSMHLYQTKHFLAPLLAHALGALSGAYFVAKLATEHQFPFAMFVGVLFLAGGITMAYQLPAPLWFTVIDIVCCYIPMAWFGYRFATRSSN
ncbi:hypothetical protein LP316_12300 [Thalassotalea sp. LPB0316]|uniref:hypothetical protein n=1 Tax=Thalassotalea sp. LPB0316 TaxID=2769490 RepID=UPI00186704CC|nr:hypothetical protein [Thalassotalea sp. LPB0316]QOL25077.1 hypothetical protein LP316_12300 [Thalassotalea sp. LPB0316]